MATIQLNSITSINVDSGGYEISVTVNPPLQPGQGILLDVGPNKRYLDISNGYTGVQMACLLEILWLEKRWAQNISCKALLVEFQNNADAKSVYGRPPHYNPSAPQAVGCKVLAESNSQNLMTPVEPFCERLTFGRRALVQIGNYIPRIPYVYDMENGQPVGRGRLLTPEINGRHYFVSRTASNWPFETDPTRRGFDCTTYILCAYDVDAGYNQGDGADIANCLDATSCGFQDAVSPAKMTEFFEVNKMGEFIMWRPGHHAVMVVDGVVHEYTTANVFGYRTRPVAEYLKNVSSGNTYQVHALPGTTAVPASVQTKPSKGPAFGIGTPTGPTGSIGNGGGAPSNGAKYTVVSGDSLSLISGRKYGDVLLWPIIYDANKPVIGSDPNMIKPGQVFTIPSIQSYSSSQLTEYRNRGRNC
ncbi:hypothetical protein F183_A15000 [Bryobacterales bacterium F-183]|nr:hypothetical protein F183_A15000 [Bryobacterales bacterium F-183]